MLVSPYSNPAMGGISGWPDGEQSTKFSESTAVSPTLMVLRSNDASSLGAAQAVAAMMNRRKAKARPQRSRPKRPSRFLFDRRQRKLIHAK